MRNVRYKMLFSSTLLITSNLRLALFSGMSLGTGQRPENCQCMTVGPM